MNSYSIPLRLAFALLPALFCSMAAFAADDLSKTVSKHKPVLLTADNVSYDEKHAIATATGNVQIVQGDTILFADKVTYDQNSNFVHAIGHVTLVEPTGDAFFGEDALLKNDMQQGVVKQFQARLKDNSLFAAREARRVNKQVTKLKKAIYSPCKVCEENGEGAPLWQVDAQKATIDENDKRVRYQGAIMDLYGIPVMYTPYFSHPTPDAPNQSGLLQPVYYNDTILGNVVKEPLYYTFAPNLDMTLTPWYMGKERPMLEGQVRGLESNGSFDIHGAITNAYNQNDAGETIPGDWTRGFLDAHGKLQLNSVWDVGLDAERVSDQTFLQYYHFSWQDLLTDRLYAERIEGRNYVSVETMTFQGLTPEDQTSATPYILPQLNMHYESDPLVAHSRIEIDSNALVLQREEGSINTLAPQGEVGNGDQRFSTTAAWKLPYITHDGQVFELSTSLRGDAYNVNSQVTNSTTGAQFSGDTGRFIPEANLDWRYPFINHFGEGKSLMIAPVVEITGSPDMHQSNNIPDEDSQVAELSDINLFSPDRFSGLDEVESGMRGAYGTRGQLQMADQQYIEWLFGQAYQEDENSPFPIANSQVAHYSDYIGRLALKYEAFNLDYSFRLNRQTFAPTSNQVNAVYTNKPLSFDITYLSLQNEPIFGDRKEVFGAASLALAPHWSLNLGGRRDLGSSEEQLANTSLPQSALNPLEPTAGTVGISSGLMFQNECIQVNTLIARSYISELDVKPSSTVGITVTFKNFGAVGPSANLTNVAGPGNITAIGEDNNVVASAPAVTQSGIQPISSIGAP